MSRHAHGFRAWIVQRLSALYMLIFILVCFIAYLNYSPINFESWQNIFHSPLTITLVSLFFISVFIHAWVGFRDIILDYVHNFVIRLFLLSVVILMLLAMGIWIVIILASAFSS